MSLDTQWAINWITAAARVIGEHREALAELDRAIGDGDHGENMDRGFSALAQKLVTDPPDSMFETLKLAATTIMSTVGGAAGPLYGTAFLRLAKAVEQAEDRDGQLDADAVAKMLAAGLEGIIARGKAEFGDKTMVDAWGPAADAAREVARSGGSAAAALRAASEAAYAGAEATEPLQARKGRASYLGERAIGHRDPGAESTALILLMAAEVAGE